MLFLSLKNVLACCKSGPARPGKNHLATTMTILASRTLLRRSKEFTNRTALKRRGRSEEIAGVALSLGFEVGGYSARATLLINGEVA